MRQDDQAFNNQKEDKLMLSDTTIRRMNALGSISLEGKRLNGLFRLMENPILWQDAYAKIYSNKGAITKGCNGNTLDGFSEDRVKNIIKLLKQKRYKFNPVRRVYIPKNNGKYRPLGIPTGDDKLVQAVVKDILEKIYEPVFKDTSHGFRPIRSCHTALQKIRQRWTSVKWIIEADIKGFFDNIDHDLMIRFLKKKIDDRRFINLIKHMLTAGYLEDWTFHKTFSGTPQGGVISPILANIYLHELDCKMEALIGNFNEGKRRRYNPEYKRFEYRISKLRKKYDAVKANAKPETLRSIRREIKELKTKRDGLPAGDPKDNSYRRLLYCRYADDFILGIIGTKSDAKLLLDETRIFVRELKLELAEEKTGIKYAKDGTRFLGYDIRSYTGQRIKKVVRKNRITTCNTTVERMQLHVPQDKIRDFCNNRGYGNYNNYQWKQRYFLLNRSIPEIIMVYNAEIRGFYNYYALANSASRVLSKMHGLWWGSLMHTLSHKMKASVGDIVRRLKQQDGSYVYFDYTGKEPRGFKFYWPKKDFKAKPLKYDKIDNQINTLFLLNAPSELIQRMDARRCEYCGTEKGYFEVHHIKKMKSITRKKELWAQIMSMMNRKTMVLCVECHDQLHAGTLPSWKRGICKENLESRIH